MALSSGAPIKGTPIDAAFIGSCTNSRLSDLRMAAQMVKGKCVAPEIKAICVPGSSRVKREAEAEDIDQIFRNAGFEWRESGYSMCFYAGVESFDAGSLVVSTTNRNFDRRMGAPGPVYLVSPAVAAASAVTGRVMVEVPPPPITANVSREHGE